MQSELSAAVQLEISDLKAKVLRLTEQSTEQSGKLTFLASMAEQVDLMEQQIIKWRYRLPDLTDDDSRERVVTAVEVQEDLYKFKDVAMRKIRELTTTLTALEGEVRLFEHDYEVGAEVRSLLPTEQLEEMDGRLAVTDENPHNPGTRSVRFWVDEAPSSPEGSRSHVDEELANSTCKCS